MTADDLARLLREALSLALLVSGPALVVAVVVGVIANAMQTVTQVQDASLSYVPKLMAVSFVLTLVGGWMTAELVTYTTHLWEQIPTLVR